MKRFLLFLALFSLLDSGNIVEAQKNDYIWLIGRNPNNDTLGQQVNILNFNQFPVEISSSDSIHIDFWESNICMSDFYGSLVFYSNGIEIYNAQHQIMSNSDDFNNYSNYDQSSFNQNLIALPPLQQNSSIYHLFHIKIDEGYVITPDSTVYVANFGVRLYYTSIDADQDNSLGAVDVKAFTLVQDSLAPGKMTAIRHANGRDWWIIAPRQNSNLFYRILLTPDGPQVLTSQNIGEPNIYATVGQAVSSPDGNWIAIDKIISHDKKFYQLEIFHFDRCTGLLSDPIRFLYSPPIKFGGGLAFSPDSRFLYQSNSSDLLQYDLLASDIIASQQVVAIYDAYYNQSGNFFFYNAQLGPDGKIYTNVSNGNNALHQINSPELPGALCEMRQRQIQLPYHSSFSIPTSPNYRLGPLDGSPCDTLGIDNMPLAGFTYEKDAYNPRFVSFSDHSFYQPQSWLWDFGDGQSSTRANPIHEYLQSGTYSVCLTVSNNYGQNTICQFVQAE